MDSDLRIALEKQREEIELAKSLARDLDLSLKLQAEEVVIDSRRPHTSSPTECSPEDLESVFSVSADGFDYSDMLLKDIDVALQTQLLCEQEVAKLNDDLDYSSEKFKLFAKGLLSTEMVKEMEMLLGGVGVAIYDSNDTLMREEKNVLVVEDFTTPQVAELTALIQGLKLALEFGMRHVTFYCDSDEALGYVIGKVEESNHSAVASLVNEVALLRSRFSFFEARHVRSVDISSVVQLARAAITSQIKWHEDGIFKEACTLCYNDVPSDEQFELPSCFHRFCVSCVNGTVKNALEQKKPVKCQRLDCESEIPRESCAAILEPELLDLMIKPEEENLIPYSERVFCPR
ncbi:hypothetical protein AALP_AA4G173800 [Arabis alpina]|uniref:RNase H type-1 domain-containing protein n=1 Tax=Arabis alpina TaxID=50452 RepID=A0A087H3V5_ARAAL|nr:hypothetical protein AALP_AA4G173800 [Arabis alpina]